MKSVHFILMATAAILIAGSCQRSNRQTESKEVSAVPSASGEYQEPAFSAMSDSASVSSLVSGAPARISKADSGRKFIRTAELKCRVKEVPASTYAIEDLVSLQQGFVALSNLQTQKDEVTITPVSEDSVFETTRYTVSNHMTIRVPNQRLDTTLKLIAKQIDFLDYRVIRADDVTFDYQSDQWAAARNKRSAERLQLAALRTKARLGELTEAEQALLEREEASDEAMLSNLRRDDQVAFSTVQLEIYQRQSVQRVMLANNERIDAYKPGFWKRVGEAFSFGWQSIQEILLFIVKIWGVLVFLFVVYVLVRVVYRRVNRKS